MAYWHPFLRCGLLLAAGLAISCRRETITTPTAAYTVSTLAGQNLYGFADGSGNAAQFSAPAGLAIDGQGILYVGDLGNRRVRRITPQGQVTTLAGSGVDGYVDGPANTAQFRSVYGVAVDGQGNVYVADQVDARIRKVSSAGQVSTLAGIGIAGYTDGLASTARFNSPTGVAVNAQGTVYVADNGNFCVRKITPTGQVSTLAGNGQRGYADGVGSSAQFNSATALALDGQGNIYVADIGNHRIRKITPAGVVSTLAGSGLAGYADGPGDVAQFNYPQSLAVAPDGQVYVSDNLNNCVRVISPAGQVSTVVGSASEPAAYADGLGIVARLNGPYGIAAPSAALIYVNDSNNQRIRQISKN